MLQKPMILEPAEPWSLRIHLLGTFTIQQGEALLALPQQSAARSLLAYLLLHHQRIFPRVQLLGLFWPDLPEQRARRALSHSLWHIRCVLPGVVHANYEAIQVLPELPVWVDVIAFECLAAQRHSEGLALANDLQQTLSLYRGDLLEGFYEEWVISERRRLQRIYHQGLAHLLRLEKSAGHYEYALELAIRLAQTDPLNEIAHREVMQLYYLLSRPEAALQQFATCSHILKTELDLEPTPETTALAREIAQRAKQPGVPYLPEAASPSAMPLRAVENFFEIPFVGRISERSWLIRQVEGTFAQAGGVVLVEGEAGVGKSRLVHEVARYLEWRGAQVLWGATSERERSSPYAPLRAALTRGLTPLRARQLINIVDDDARYLLYPLLLADQDTQVSIGYNEEPARLIKAFSQLLIGWARITPLVLILDDLHQADAHTWEILFHLMQQLHDHSVMIIGLYRREEARALLAIWEQLQELSGHGMCARLTLPRLDLAAIGRLIHHSLGQPAPTITEYLYQLTGGNPLFILEMLGALYDAELLRQRANGSWQITWSEQSTVDGKLPVASTIEQLVLHRVAALPQPLVLVLEALAVLGDLGSFDLVQALSGLAVQPALIALRELVHLDLLGETPQGYCFSHTIMRQVVHAHLSADERIVLHRRAGQLLEASHADQAALLAYHFTQAQLWDKALLYHRQAGMQAHTDGEAGLAVEHFSAAIDLVLSGQASLEEQAFFDLLSARDSARQLFEHTEPAPDSLAMTATWEICQQQRIAVHLPRMHAPRGRQSRDTEKVPVIWTVNAPEDELIASKVARRHHRLRRLLAEAAAQGASPTTADLAAALRSGQRTIEQDLRILRKHACGVYLSHPSNYAKEHV